MNQNLCDGRDNFVPIHMPWPITKTHKDTHTCLLNTHNNPQALKPTDMEAGLQSVEMLAETPLACFSVPNQTLREKASAEWVAGKQRKLSLGCPVAGLTRGPMCGTPGSRQAGWEVIPGELLGLYKR